LRDNGNQEVEKDNQHEHDQHAPKEPGVADHEVRQSVGCVQFNSLAPVRVVGHCQVSNTVSKDLDGIEDVFIQEFVFWIVSVVWHVNPCNAVQETENDDPCYQEKDKGFGIKQGLFDERHQHAEGFIESEQEHHLAHGTNQQYGVDQEPPEH